MENQVKTFYQSYHDRISDKRWNSPYPLRRYVHQSNYAQILNHVKNLTPNGGRVLDAGCGDGLLSLFIAEALLDRGITVSGVDISLPNIESALKRQKHLNHLPNLHYELGDAERLPFADHSFDLVISSHVLEHLPDFDAGQKEIHRLTKKYAIVALPTCLNPCAMVQLGGDVFWRPFSRRSLYAFWIGLVKTITNLGGAGVDEGYAGQQGIPHIWRYPWVMRRQLQQGGFKIERFEAQTLCVPYLGSLFPGAFLRLQGCLDRLRSFPIIRNFGYGSLAILSKVK